MLPFVQNVYVTVKFSPKVYRNVTHARWKLLVLVVDLVDCWTSARGWSCLSTTDVLFRVLFGMSVNVAGCLVRMFFAMSGNVRMLLGISGNVGELAGCWVQDPTATKYMLQPRVNLPLGYLS